MGKRLVRDRALDTWAVPGAEHQVRPVHDRKEHQELIVVKVIEEAAEIIFAKTREELTKEIGDMLSVLEGVARVNNLEWDDVCREAAKRNEASGGFTEGMVWETPR